ncbi:MAG: nucleotide exchange factor GrpE [Candidatus Theseobacter exili]|nr:nucleotide exchange factor GrpE [Candidatus Theseobacter exili]
MKFTEWNKYMGYSGDINSGDNFKEEFCNEDLENCINIPVNNGNKVNFHEDSSIELKDCQNSLKRLQADFDNYRKRTNSEKKELEKKANQGLILELLPVLDHFEIGIQTGKDHDVHEAVTDGFQIVFNQLMDVLVGNGLAVIDTEGIKFNPHVHDCIAYEPSEIYPEDTIIQQTRSGYTLYNRVIRPSKVIVSSGLNGMDMHKDADEDGRNGWQ